MFRQIKFKHLLKFSYVRALPGSKCEIDNTAVLSRCHIIVSSNGALTIEEGAKLSNVVIYVGSGSVYIGKHSIIGSRFHRVEINIREGETYIADHCRLSPLRIWCRFGGTFTVNSYTNVNDYSEIRCDEKVAIGCFCRISYNVRIWDTNTHTLLPKDKRREVTIRNFPGFGLEEIKPKTSPTIIGDDCWIGEYSAISKGVTIGDQSVIGYGTFLTNKNIPKGSLVVNPKEVSIIKRDI